MRPTRKSTQAWITWATDPKQSIAPLRSLKLLDKHQSGLQEKINVAIVRTGHQHSARHATDGRLLPGSLPDRREAQRRSSRGSPLFSRRARRAYGLYVRADSR